MRVLLDESGRFSGEVHDDALAAAYATPDGERVLRANMVSTVDGAATGDSGLSDSINDEADGRVFAVLRRWADAVLVGAGTAEAEGYGPLDDTPLVLVSRRGRIPGALADQVRSGEGGGRVLLATTGSAEGLGEARDLLGAEAVLLADDGDGGLAFERLRLQLHERGHRRLLSEGGPTVLARQFAAGVVDELCLTWVPRLLADDRPRILAGPGLDVRLTPRLLLEHHGTLLGRWVVER